MFLYLHVKISGVMVKFIWERILCLANITHNHNLLFLFLCCVLDHKPKISVLCGSHLSGTTKLMLKMMICWFCKNKKHVVTVFNLASLCASWLPDCLTNSQKSVSSCWLLTGEMKHSHGTHNSRNSCVPNACTRTNTVQNSREASEKLLLHNVIFIFFNCTHTVHPKTKWDGHYICPTCELHWSGNTDCQHMEERRELEKENQWSARWLPFWRRPSCSKNRLCSNKKGNRMNYFCVNET